MGFSERANYAGDEYTFTVCLHVTFKDAEAHDRYQVDPLHTAFLARHKAAWRKVVIYDSQMA